MAEHSVPTQGRSTPGEESKRESTAQRVSQSSAPIQRASTSTPSGKGTSFATWAPHRLENCRSCKIPGTKWTLQGHSRAGERTGFIVPELKLVLDAGVPSMKSPLTICVTHTHTDHTTALQDLIPREAKVNVLAPVEAWPALEYYLNAVQSLADGVLITDRKDNKMFVDAIIPHEMKPGALVEVNKRSIHIEAFACKHRVPCLAYGISSARRKLRSDLQGLPGKDIAKLREQGEDVTEAVTIPQFIFFGDTTHEALENEEVWKYPVVIIECTNFDGDPEATLARTHMHWEYLKPHVVAHPSTHFILIHGSLRYSEEELAAVVKDYSNVTVWTDTQPLYNMPGEGEGGGEGKGEAVSVQ